MHREAADPMAGGGGPSTPPTSVTPSDGVDGVTSWIEDDAGRRAFTVDGSADPDEVIWVRLS